jgi:DNA-binding transcriptional regulator YhcF (GntR family)
MFIPTINPQVGIPKFQQLIESIENAVNSNQLKVGDSLPSVNKLCEELNLSRDTVFKAYSELKKRGVIESYPNKGYFIASNQLKVFLFLDTFKAYKEVLYGAFLKALPRNYTVDLHFHHYHFDLFKNLLSEAAGKYSRYVIMSFDHPEMAGLLESIDKEKLLVIDWNIHTSKDHSFVCQDFGQPVLDNLNNVSEVLKKYKRLIYLYPQFTYHPKVSIEYFQAFCQQGGFEGKVIYNMDELQPQKGDAYLSVSDRALVQLLDMAHEKGLTLGKDIGIISYNETPMKKYVKEGITVLSTDFEDMGREAARFVAGGEPVRKYIPTTIIQRASL